MKKQCKQCQKEFEADNREVKRGNGKFCSRKCSSQHTARHRIKPVANVSCAFCNKAFYLNASKQAKSKSGLFFCCRKHKDTAQRIGGIEQIQPKHYGINNGKHSYRVRAINAYGNKCNRCGYDENSAAIVVHHIDWNHNNTKLSNLEVLCANCHAIEHWSKK
jgi:hypothetical protein